MARVWPLYAGRLTTVGRSWAELPLEDAIRILELEPHHFLQGPVDASTVGDARRDRTSTGDQHLVVEIGDDEVKNKEGWKAGFYRSPRLASEAFYRLLEWRIEQRIGPCWHVRLEEGQDADGDTALWAWVTLKADAPSDTWTRERREHIQSEIRDLAAESAVADWVFVRFRKEKEVGLVS